jgi:predicted negative regulator of RcsB-dependent stress response
MILFFNKNFKILIFFTIGFFSIFQAFNKKHYNDNLVASEIYINLIDREFFILGVLNQTKYLVSNYTCSIYSDFLHLEFAKYFVLQKKFFSAIKHLKLIVKYSESMHLRTIAALRMARIYLALDCSSLALLILTNITELSYVLSKDILFGYIYLAQDKPNYSVNCLQHTIRQLSKKAVLNYDRISYFLISRLNFIE